MYMHGFDDENSNHVFTTLIATTSLFEFCQLSQSGPLMGAWVLSPKPPMCGLPSCRHHPALAAMQSACHRGRWVSPLWYPEWEPYRVPIPGLVWRSDPSSGSLDSHQYLSDHQYLDGIMRHRDYHKRKSYLHPSPCCLHESIYIVVPYQYKWTHNEGQTHELLWLKNKAYWSSRFMCSLSWHTLLSSLVPRPSRPSICRLQY